MTSQSKSAVSTSVRVSELCDCLWEASAEQLGLSKAAILEVAIRKLARAENVVLSSHAIAVNTDEKTESTQK